VQVELSEKFDFENQQWKENNAKTFRCFPESKQPQPKLRSNESLKKSIEDLAQQFTCCQNIFDYPKELFGQTLVFATQQFERQMAFFLQTSLTHDELRTAMELEKEC